jgi:isoamylase
MLDLASIKVKPGAAFPLGATAGESGVRFAVVSRHATRVWLALFENRSDVLPAIEIAFDAKKHRIGDVWSIHVKGVGAGALYMYRMDGPYLPEEGHRFDSSLYLFDPYAKTIVGDIQKRTAKCVAVDSENEWIPDRGPQIPQNQTLLYETHVRGLTIHKSSRVENPGTYRGLIEKLPYLKSLGVTAVELMPVQEIGERELPVFHPETGKRLVNYWGYNPIGFFAPAARYACPASVGDQLDEFREMVAAVHAAGLEIFLDVVFNHTAEGNEKGPALCFRGIDNAIYYLLDQKGSYANYTGCGNTVNCNHPLVRDLILDCLRYWATAMHVDGFRFDLASVLGRDRYGRIVENAPIVERIAEDPVLRHVKLIAEAWDAGGAYQVGSFGDTRWAELNGKFRDDVRRYWRGDEGLKGNFVRRITGSPDLYQSQGRTAMHSINFITSHDGFTLHDLVSYNRKHNEDNGEGNRDGLDENLSWNCGVEGETTDEHINKLRRRMQRNYIATLYLSLGVPMMLGGDEFGRTQYGNNNAYCQDNEISWYDWDLAESNQDLIRFTREVIRFRKENPVFLRVSYFTGQNGGKTQGKPDVLWLAPDRNPLNWADRDPAFAWWIHRAENAGTALYLAYNPTKRTRRFIAPKGAWLVRIDTARRSPYDVVRAEDARGIRGRAPKVTVKPHAMVVLSAE